MSIASLLLIVAGLGLLAAGGEVMVRGASALAVRLRLTPAVIGLTVMAVGTSLPELMVSVVAQIQDQPAFSFGNVVGSNIFNIGLVLGFCGCIRPFVIPGNTVRLEWPFMFVASFLLILLSRDGQLDALEGGFFLVAFTIFNAYMVRLARIEVGKQESESFQLAVEGAAGHDPARRPLLRPVSFVVAGGVALWFGAEMLIEGAKDVVLALGISETVVAVLVLAAGTGLPELTVTFFAVLHRKTDMAVGNVVGSNICNILLILGTASLIRPLEVETVFLSWHLWWMIGISFILGPFLLGKNLSRKESFVLLVVYAAYVGMLIAKN
ncbi:MAG: calcium/sodium antiporter [Planctomycetota bacterium]|nr:calcium/sodium antiporter [Planctomycetota bacterium]